MISWTDLLTSTLNSKSGLTKTLKANRSRYSSLKSPKVVVWNITSRCNLACQHCYFEATPRKETGELNTEEAKSFIKGLAKFSGVVLLFSGGEPLLRKDIFQLGSFARDNGISPALSTNGTLISDEVSKKIKEAGFSYVGISLDGMEKNNDEFRKKQGAFSKSLAGIKNCKKQGLKTGLRFTLTKYNFKDLTDIFELAERESIPRLCIYHLVYTGRGDSLRSKDLTYGEKRQALELIWQKTLNFHKKGLNIEILTVDNHTDGVWIYLKLVRKNPNQARIALELLKIQGGNNSGMRIGAVDNLGNVHADQFLRTHPLGNIRNRGFADIWRDKNNSFLKALRNRKPFLKGRCQRCNYFALCNGNFRARAEAVSGDLWQEDPACYLTEEEITNL